MSVPLLATKLFIPLPGSHLVERARLLEQLDACLRPGCRLALLSAPAGFGKTTLASAWIQAAQSRKGNPAAAWLSLDEQDNDLNRFWSYVMAAFQTFDSQLGKDAQTLLSAGQINSTEPILSILINDLARIPSPILLVLDDFHLIEQEAILNSMAFLLERLPPNVHVMILTRSDPHLPLARFRSRNQLLEIRLADLRFSLEETDTFLNTAMKLALASGPIETLYAKTEGWAAGLQMASLALQSMMAQPPAAGAGAAKSHGNVEEFVASFSGSNRFILDYLLEEVLQRQPKAVQEFLLKTSILERFCADLCEEVMRDAEREKDVIRDSVIRDEEKDGIRDADKNDPPSSRITNNESRITNQRIDESRITSSSPSPTILEYLERENLFLIPLDAERCWYRYHALFADLLKKRLRQTHPADESELHARASRWYAENSLPHQAVEHAYQALDYARAGQLLEETGEAILKHGEYQWLLQWIQRLPREQLQSHGILYLYQATVLASVGQLNQAEQCLLDFEQSRPADPARSQLPDWLAGRMATIQALIAIFRGDAAAARCYARTALDTIPSGSDSPWRAHLLIALSHINQVDGNLADARQNLVDAIEAGKQAGDIYMTLDATTHLVMMLCNQGRLQQAGTFARQGLQYVERFGLGSSTEASMLYLAWGFILCEQHMLEEAGENIRRGLDACRQANIPGMIGWAYKVNTRFLIAKGDWQNAEDLAQAAYQLTKEVEIPAWIESECAALRAQVWIRQGQLAKAEQYLRERGIFPTAEFRIPAYTEYAALGSLLLAKGELDAAEQVINQLLERSSANGHQRLVIVTLIHLALLYQARGNQPFAVQTLDRALEIAEPEGYIQLFLDEGPALAGLLGAAARQGSQAGFAEKLRTALSGTPEQPEPQKTGEPSPASPELTGERSPLSQRENEVLDLLAEGLSNKEIAQRLYISVRTVKYHTTNIFTKLNVDNRTQAVLQAKKLNHEGH